MFSLKLVSCLESNSTIMLGIQENVDSTDRGVCKITAPESGTCTLGVYGTQE